MIRELRNKNDELIWVSVNHFGFRRDEVRWLLDYLPMVREGRWPAYPVSSGYEDPGIQHTRGFHATFEKPCQVAAELGRRLKELGLSTARYVIEEHFYRGMCLEQLAVDTNTTVIELEAIIEQVIGYVGSGACPRYLHCSDCHYKECRVEPEKRNGRKVCSWKEWIGHRRN